MVSKVVADAAVSARWSRWPRSNIAGRAVLCGLPVTEGRRRLGEHDLQFEQGRVEGDEAIEILGHHRDVVDAGAQIHRVLLVVGGDGRREPAAASGARVRARAPSRTSSIASAAVSAASAPSTSQ